MKDLPLNPSAFLKGVLAELVIQGEHVVQPRNGADRRGFRELVSLLEKRADSLRSERDQSDPFYRALVRLKNHLKPSNNGSFDNIESLLRDLQTSAVMHPNPDYEEMTVQLSRPFAESFLSDLPELERRLVHDAASAFHRAKSADYLD